MPRPILERIGPAGSVALIRLRSLGDTVLTTPAIRMLRRSLPQGRIHVVIERRFADVLEDHPDIDGILTIDRNAALREKLGLLRRIRSLGAGLCWDLHGGSTSAWLTALSRAPHRAGYAHFRHGWAYNARIPRAQEVLGRDPQAAVHTAEHHAAGALFLGARTAQDGPDIPAANLGARAAPGRRRPYAVLHPTAAFFTKQWGAANFRRIAASIRERRGLDPVFIAGPGEEEAFADLEGFECLRAPDLGELKTLLAGARLFVGNDSGPAHAAAAFQVPSVVIFGSSNSAVWRPWKAPHRVVETSWDCKPCPGDRCYAFDEPRCILSVEPDAVERAIDDLLRAEGAADQLRSR